LMTLHRMCSEVQITKLLVKHLSPFPRYFFLPLRPTYIPNTLFRNTPRLCY
jgi:hypothetical protein